MRTAQESAPQTSFAGTSLLLLALGPHSEKRRIEDTEGGGALEAAAGDSPEQHGR